MKVTIIEGIQEEVQKTLQAIGGSEERSDLSDVKKRDRTSDSLVSKELHYHPVSWFVPTVFLPSDFAG